ncbi:MAG: hypothetical protein MK102_03270 [Fuerstiella sp.]|nr:hypothetical protein [Fuerstiella sp.]
MSQGNSIPRVSGDVPWWLWLFAGLSTVAVIIGIAASQEKETAEEIFARGITIMDDPAMQMSDTDLKLVEECLISLQRFEGVDEEITILKGLRAVITNRFPRCVQVMEPFLNHPDIPKRKTALKCSAIACSWIGDADRARQLHEQCASVDPADPVPHAFLMRLYNNAGAFSPAIESAQTVLENEPGNVEAMELIGQIKVETGDMDGAKEWYSRMLETEQDRLTASPDVIKNYVNVLIKTDGIEVAFEFAEENASLLSDEGTQLTLLMGNNLVFEASNLIQSMEPTPDNPFLAQLEGLRAFNAGSWETAVGMLAQAAIRMPRSTQVFEQLKLAAEKNNQADLVQACLENLDAIHKLEKQMYDGMQAIGDDMVDPELRLSVANVATDLGRLLEAAEWINRAANVCSERQSEFAMRTQNLKLTTQLLVPIDAAFRKTTKIESESSPETAEDSGVQEPSSDDDASSETAELSDDNETVDKEPTADQQDTP